MTGQVGTTGHLRTTDRVGSPPGCDPHAHTHRDTEPEGRPMTLSPHRPSGRERRPLRPAARPARKVAR